MAELFRNKYRIRTTHLQNWDYSSESTYFITICTKNRKNYFGEITSTVVDRNSKSYTQNNV